MAKSKPKSKSKFGPSAKGARKYHVVAVNDKTGLKVRLTETPVTHTEGCIILSKQAPYKHVRKLLEPSSKWPVNVYERRLKIIRY